MVIKRSIGMAVFLSIITCGIYSLYWLAVMANDLNAAAEEQDTTGGMVVLFSIITCGIYLFYWLYKAGTKVRAAQTKRNFPTVTDSGVVYILLALFGLSLISYILIQSELNKISDFDAKN